MRTVALCLLLALMAAPVQADVALRFRTLTIDDGLAQNSVTAITQDSYGYLWFGSQDGLSRYDGLRFTTFKNDPNDTRSVPANYIDALLAGDNGDVWVGTRFGGLARYDAATGRFERIPLAYDGDVHDSRFVVHALARYDGTLWAALDRGLARLDAEARVLKLVPRPGAQLFAETRALFADDAGLWIGGVGRVLLLDASGDFRSVPLPESNLVAYAFVADAGGALHVASNRGVLRLNAAGVFERLAALPPARFNTLERDGEGGLWVGGRGTGAWYRPNGGPNDSEWQHFAWRADDPAGIGQDILFDIHADRDDVVWIGTYGGGLSRTALAQRRFGLQQRRAGDDNGLASNIVFPIHEDANGIVWIGLYNDGLNRWDRANDRWTHYRHDPRDPGSLVHDEVRALLTDAAGRLWVGTHGGLDRLDPGADEFVHYRHDPDDPHSLMSDGITRLFIDSAGRFWIGTWGAGLELFDPVTGRFTHYRPDPSNPEALSSGWISDIVEAPDGALWIATERGGVNRFDPATSRFKQYRHRDDNPASLVDDSVNTLWLADEYLWIGTANGLDRLHIETGAIRHYRERDGLANNLVLGILGDDDGDLWISTNRGLSRFDPVTQTFRTYRKTDGLQSDEYNSFAYFRNARGELYFGGIEGFNVFDPAAIKRNPEPPVVRITGLSLFNTPLLPAPENPQAILRRPADHTDAIALQYAQNLFAVEFAALDFLDPERNRFRYRLRGFSNDWIETGADTPFATYTNLDPGNYIFEVHAANPDGAWSTTPAQLEINVLPPWWRTWPAHAAYALFVIGLALLVLQYQRKRIEVRYLAREKDAAEEATRLKSSFLALMSHEIRTPMSGVLGMVQLLARTRLSRRQRGYVEALEKSGESLLTILDDVLDFSRIEANVIEFESIPFDPREVAESVVLLLGPRAREKRLALALKADALPPAVRGDPTRLRQVLMNLVANAIKFTAAGGVTVSIESQPLDDVHVRLGFAVEDTGIGISLTRQATLFEAFVQADATTHRAYGGTGLGLSICKRLVDMQGGEIGVESAPGAGSCFWFELTLERATPPPHVEAVTVRPGRVLRVLLVEDQPVNQEVARGLLEHEGHAVSVAPDGPTALRLISEREFDVVLMDIHMPGMDGREVTRRIRALDDPLKAAVPVLGLTASISADDVAACLTAGMNKVLRKPLPAARLIEALARLDDDAEVIETQQDDELLVDVVTLVRHRDALGEERFQEILATFMQTGGALVDALEAAALADDAAAIRRDAHRLAGAAASLGCNKLAALAARVEEGQAEPDSLRSVYRRTEHALHAAARAESA